MPDVFSRNTDTRFAGSFAADAVTLTFPALIAAKGAASGLLVQNLQATYQQQVTRLFEIGSPDIYYVGGRTSGQGTMGRIVGPRLIAKEFYLTYGDICRARTNILHFSMAQPGCSEDDPDGPLASFTAYFVVITQIGISVAAQEMLINEQLQYMFSSFKYNEPAP